MHNGRLLLLVFLAVFQPIASFTERSLVDGRNQRCESSDHRLGDNRLSYGSRLKLEDRRLSRQGVVRQDQRHEVRVDHHSLLAKPLVTRLVEVSSERVDTRVRREIAPRFERIDYRRGSDNRYSDRVLAEGRGNRIRRTQPVQHDLSREDRTRQNVRERFTRNVVFRQDDRNYREPSNTRSHEARRERRSRNSMEAQSNTRRFRDMAGEQKRIQETREAGNVFQRARNDVASRSLLERDFRETRPETANRRLEPRSEARRYNSRTDQREDRNMIGNRQYLAKSRSIDRVRDARERSRVNLRETSDDRESMRFRRDLDEQAYNRYQRDAKARVLTMRIRRDSLGSVERRAGPEPDRKRNAEDRVVRFEQRRFRDDARLYRAAREREDIRSTEPRMDNRRSENRRQIRNARPNNRERRHLDVTREAKAFQAQRQAKDLERPNLVYHSPVNTKLAITRVDSAFLGREKGEPQPIQQSGGIDWQYLFYTLQGIYLCGMLVQLLNETGTGKKKSKALNWWKSTQSVKVD